MIEVRIRKASDTLSSYLCDVPFDEIADIIPTLTSYTIEGERPDMSAQFVVEQPHRQSYFEVVIADA